MLAEEFTVLSDRFRFFPPHRDYAPSYFANVSGDVQLTRYTQWCTHRNLAQAQSRLNLMIASTHSQYGRYWLIAPADRDECIGVLCSRWDNTYSRDVGFILARAWQGKGIIAAAIPLVCQRVFFGRETRRVWSLCSRDNAPVITALQRAGLSQEAVLRKHTLFPNYACTPSDVVMHSWIPGNSEG